MTHRRNIYWAFTLLASVITLVSAIPSAVERTPDKSFPLAKRATCTPQSAASASTDDVPAITAAIASCGDGGTIVLPAGVQYTIRSPVDFTGCVNCDFQIEGTLKASDDLNYWYGKEAIFIMSGIKGAKVRSVTGTGVIDGNGQAAWDYFATNSSLKRPALYTVTNSCSDISISNLRVKNPPGIFFYAGHGSTRVKFSSLYMTASSKSTNLPKNTDGFDIGESVYVTVADTSVTNNDDCVAFKAGSNYVTVTNITCIGSHGLSVGSLGKSPGSVDTVQNIYVNGANMVNSSKAVGIKIYPGGSTYGSAIVSNVTWSNIKVANSDYAAQISACYANTADFCAANPSNATIANIKLVNFSGLTSTHYEPTTSDIRCPPKGSCNVAFTSYSVLSPYGSSNSKVICVLTTGTITGVSCSSP